MRHAITEFIPIAVYNKDGSPKKDIMIIPSRGQVRLNDHTSAPKKIPFAEVGKEGFLEELKEFMGSDFHIDPQETHDRIVKMVSQIAELRKLFAQVYS